MDNTVLAAIIGVSGIVVGAVIQTVGPDLIKRMGLRRLQRELEGEWHVTWEWKEEDEDDTKHIEDVVELCYSRNGQVTGKGIGSQYSYKVEGWDSLFAITLAYSGLDMEKNCVGTVLLRKGVANNEMSGRWSQVTRTGTLVSGDTQWKRNTGH